MKAYPYQEDDVAWMLEDRYPDVVCPWHEMGVGKTVEAAMLVEKLVTDPRRDWGVVVFVPAAVRDTWERELRRWAPSARVRVARLARPASKPRKDGTRLRAKRPADPFVWPEPGEVVVYGYSTAQRGLGAVAQRCPGLTALILDEAHVLSGTSRQANELGGRMVSGRPVGGLIEAVLAAGGKVLHMTGTPFENDPEELRRQLKRLRVFGRTFGTDANFERHFGASYDRHGNVFWDPAPPSILPVVSQFVRRRLADDVLPDLPPVKRSALVSLPADAERPLERMERLVGVSAESGGPAALAALGRALHAEGPALSTLRVEVARAKIPWLLEVLDELEASRPDETLCAYSYHVDEADEAGFVQTFRQRPGWVVVVGSTPPRERRRRLDAYRRGRAHLACSSAIATGLTLHGGEYGRCNRILVRLDLSWTPLRTERQLIKRWHRPGLIEPVEVVDLVVDHYIERAVYRAHATKNNRFDSVLAAERGCAK